MLGGEERVRELLENESRKQLTEPLLRGEASKGVLQETSFTNFFCQPSVLGKDLYTIVKFGLVQYVSWKFFLWLVLLILLGINRFYTLRWFWKHSAPSWHYCWSILVSMVRGNLTGIMGMHYWHISWLVIWSSIQGMSCAWPVIWWCRLLVVSGRS